QVVSVKPPSLGEASLSDGTGSNTEISPGTVMCRPCACAYSASSFSFCGALKQSRFGASSPGTGRTRQVTHDVRLSTTIASHVFNEPKSLKGAPLPTRWPATAKLPASPGI